MREKILKCLGIFPERAEPDLEILKEEDLGSYTRQLIRYSSEPGERIPAYLLIPKDGKERHPGILAIHQHAGQWHLGKSEVVGLGGDRMFAYGLDLVGRGYAVLAPDQLCFEDRIREPYRGSRERQNDYERYEFLKRVQNGSCLQTKYLHDLSAALDVLCSLDCVDPERIGAVGHSLGGQESAWIAWYDDRVRAAVSSCGVGMMSSIIRHDVLHCYALYVPGLGRVCDMDEIIREIAPRGFLMTSGLRDEAHFPVDGIEAIERANAENPGFVSVRFNDGHRFNDPEKKTAYEWLDRMLEN